MVVERFPLRLLALGLVQGDKALPAFSTGQTSTVAICASWPRPWTGCVCRRQINAESIVPVKSIVYGELVVRGSCGAGQPALLQLGARLS